MATRREKVIYEAEVNAGQSFSDLDKLAEKFENVKKRELELRDGLAQYRKQLKEIANNPELGRHSKEYDDVVKNIIATETSLKATRKEQRELNKEFEKLATPVNSIARLRKETNELAKTLDNAVRGVTLTEKEFDDLADTVARNRKEIIKFDQNLNDGRSNVGRYSQSLSGLTGGFAAIGSSIVGAFAIGEFTQFVDEATQAYEFQVQNEAKLSAALEGRIDVQERLLAQANDIQAQTNGLFTDEQIIEQQAYLAALGATEEQIKDIIAASIDLSVGANIPLESSVRNLGKTYSGLAGELGEAIPGLRELTKEQLQAGAAVELVTEQFEGQALAAGEAGLGPIRGYREAIGDVKEEIGGELLPVQEALTRSQLFFFEAIRDGLKIGARWLVQLQQFPKFVEENKVTIAALVIALATLNSAQIAATINTLRQAAAQKAITVATRAQIIAQRALNLVLNANPIGLIVAGVGLLIAAYDQAIKRSSEFRAMISGIQAAGRELFNIFKEAFGAFVQAFNQIREGDFTAAISSIGEGLRKGNPISIAFTEGERLGKAFTEGYEESKIQDRIKAQSEAIRSEGNEFQKAGEELGDKLGDGVAKGLGGSDASGTKIAQDSLKGLRDELSKLETQLQQTSATDTTQIQQKLEQIAATKDRIAELESTIEALNLELQKQDDEALFNVQALLTPEQIAEQTGQEVEGGLPTEVQSLTGRIEEEQFIQDEILRIKQEAWDKEVQQRQQQIQQLQDIENQRTQALQQAANTAATLTGEFIGSALSDGEEFSEQIIALALSTLERLALLAVAEAQIKEIGSKGFIGIGTGAALAVIIRGIFSAVRRAVLGEYGLVVDDFINNDFKAPKKEYFIPHGPSHKSKKKGVPVAPGVLAEAHETIMKDEFGRTIIINKKSTQKHRSLLRRIMGRSFPGKLALLDLINQSEGGNPLMGTKIRKRFSTTTVPPIPRFQVPIKAKYIKMQSGGVLENSATNATSSFDNTEVVNELKSINERLSTLSITVDELDKAERNRSLSNQLSQA